MWLALLACAGMAQDPATGTVVGRIEDVNGDHSKGEWVVELSGNGLKTVQVERKNGEFRFADVKPGTVRLFASCTDMAHLSAENKAVEVEPGKETYVVLRDDSRWVEVQLKELRSATADQYEGFAAVTLLGANGYEETAKYLYHGDSTYLFEGVGDPPFRVRLGGGGIEPLEVEGLALCSRVELDVRGTGAIVFEAQDEASEFLLEGAEFYLTYYGVGNVLTHPYWWYMDEPKLNVVPGEYTVLLKLMDGLVFSNRVVVSGDAPTVLPIALGDIDPLLLDLPAGDARTEVWIDSITYPDHLAEAGLVVPDLWELRAKGTQVETGWFPHGTLAQVTVHWGPWFQEERMVTIDGSVKTLEPGPMAFVEVDFEHDGSALEGIFPALRSSVPGHIHHSRAQWNELHTREPVRPGRVAVGLIRDGAMIYLPEIEVADGEVARFPTIRVSEWIPTRCPLTVTVDGEVVTTGFAVSPTFSAHVLDDQLILGVAPGEVDILLYDQQGTWLLRPEDLVLEPGDERPLQFEVTRTARRVRFFDRDGEPAARRRIAIKRRHPDNEAYFLTSRVKTDEDGWAELRYTPGTLTFSRLGREVTVDWPIETDTLTLK